VPSARRVSPSSLPPRPFVRDHREQGSIEADHRDPDARFVMAAFISSIETGLFRLPRNSPSQFPHRAECDLRRQVRAHSGLVPEWRLAPWRSWLRLPSRRSLSTSTSTSTSMRDIPYVTVRNKAVINLRARNSKQPASPPASSSDILPLRPTDLAIPFEHFLLAFQPKRRAD
jgi:hypothetical protein